MICDSQVGHLSCFCAPSSARFCAAGCCGSRITCAQLDTNFITCRRVVPNLSNRQTSWRCAALMRAGLSCVESNGEKTRRAGLVKSADSSIISEPDYGSAANFRSHKIKILS